MLSLPLLMQRYRLCSFLSLLGCSRITSSRALPFGNALHSTLTIRFFLRNKKEKMNKELHNLCMWSIDTHIMNYATNYSSLRLNTAINASCGTSTRPTDFIRFLPFFCFSRSLRFLVISPP